MPRKVRVAILGGSGYTAIELIKILLRHPGVEIAAITSRAEAGKRIDELHPRLTGILELPCEPFDPDRLQNAAIECVFGCLPHGVSAEAIAPLLERGLRVIDLSADYRLKNPSTYAQWYGHEHQDTAHLAHAVYGLPELNREQIRTTQLLANPGCYPQTAILGLAPLLAAHEIDPAQIIIDSKSGISGAGRSPKLLTHYPECNENFLAYNVGQHRHTPEIDQALSEIAGVPISVCFTPHLTPMDRGIFSTIYTHPWANKSQADWIQLYRDYYRDCPFIRIRDELPCTKDTAGTNFLDISVRLVSHRLIILVAEDNLVRGASGVAVQNFNWMYDFPETTALLDRPGLEP